MNQLKDKGRLLIKRIIAYSIDAVLASYLCIGVILLLLPLSMYISRATLLSIIDNIDAVVTCYTIIFLYFLVQEIFWHKTVGKKLLGLEIIHSDRKKIRWYQLIIRNIFRFIDVVIIVGFLITPFTSKTQRLGDMISKTMVVEKRKKNKNINCS